MAPTRTPAPGRRFGYLIAVAINAALLWVAHQLLGWGWPSFLTEQFDEVLPILTLSFVASIVTNALYVVADPPRFKALGDAVTSAIAVAVALRTWQVVPFDVSNYGYDWSWLVRVVIVVGGVGSAIAVVVNVVTVLRPPNGPGHPPGADA